MLVGIATGEGLSASVAILNGPSPASDADAESLAARVLKIYAAALARSLNERSAFKTAASLYCDAGPDLTEDDVRGAVANIIRQLGNLQPFVPGT